MKILHILSQIPDATGSGIYLQAALRHSTMQGFDNALLAGVPVDSDHLECLDINREQYHPVLFGDDIPFPVVGMSDVMPYPSTRFCDLSTDQLDLYIAKFEQKLIEAVEQHQPDLIHSHHLWLLTSLAKQKFPDIPIVTSCHGSDLRQFHNCSHLHPLVLPGCQNIDTVCALSTIQKLEIEQLYKIDKSHIEVIGVGYDCQRFFWPPNKNTAESLQILYAGKLSRAKGVPWLLKALQLLPQKNFTFHLVGDGYGQEKDEIMELAANLGSRIKIYGKLEQHQLAELMRLSDIFVLPSFFEGLPLVLLEALASGCHIVTTALPGISELFSEVNSDWVELIDLPQMISIDTPHPADEGHFINNLISSIDNQCNRLKMSNEEKGCPTSLRRLLRQYTWEGIFSKLEKLYRSYSV
jgi:alpha-maltose-1-phosphate synthase